MKDPAEIARTRWLAELRVGEEVKVRTGDSPSLADGVVLFILHARARFVVGMKVAGGRGRPVYDHHAFDGEGRRGSRTHGPIMVIEPAVTSTQHERNEDAPQEA